MPHSRYKLNYECDCLDPVGYTCGKRNYFLLDAFHTIDMYILYHKRHADDPESRLEKILTLTENDYSALHKILNHYDEEESLSRWEPEDYKETDRI